MHCVRNAYRSLMKAARAAITVRFADDRLRRQIVDGDAARAPRWPSRALLADLIA